MHLYYIYVGWQQFFSVDKLFSPDPYCFHSVGTYYVFRFTVYTLCLHTYKIYIVHALAIEYDNTYSLHTPCINLNNVKEF